ncbi:hypothetical protein EVAR_55821_1 [Eumeta japonica]|uniref:Uncharacterized protein n=1 Tax=Eumeta variegata TaxID=151549 RepID=A0A4C1ZCZ5_EUMVA|nr:hypothetical protein EVAR_55821_1 [Eumeta japonica]
MCACAHGQVARRPVRAVRLCPWSKRDNTSLTDCWGRLNSPKRRQSRTIIIQNYYHRCTAKATSAGGQLTADVQLRAGRLSLAATLASRAVQGDPFNLNRSSESQGA